MNIVINLLRYLLFACMSAVAILIFVQLIFRNTDISISGFDELVGICAIWAYFFGMAHSTLSKSHIKGGLEELIDNVFARKAFLIISFMALLLFSIISLIVSIQIFITAYVHKYVTLYFSIPVTISIAALIVGFALNLLFLSVSAVGSLKNQTNS